MFLNIYFSFIYKANSQRERGTEKETIHPQLHSPDRWNPAVKDLKPRFKGLRWMSHRGAAAKDWVILWYSSRSWAGSYINEAACSQNSSHMKYWYCTQMISLKSNSSDPKVILFFFKTLKNKMGDIQRYKKCLEIYFMHISYRYQIILEEILVFNLSIISYIYFSLYAAVSNGESVSTCLPGDVHLYLR